MAYEDVHIYSGCDSPFDLNGTAWLNSWCMCWRIAIHVKNATFYCVSLMFCMRVMRKDKSTTFAGNRIINNTWISFFFFRSIQKSGFFRALSSHSIWLCIVVFLMLLKIKINVLWICVCWLGRLRGIEPQNSALCNMHTPCSVWCGIFSHGLRWNTQMFFILFHAIFLLLLWKTNRIFYFWNVCDYSRRKMYWLVVFYTNLLNRAMLSNEMCRSHPSNEFSILAI